MVKYKYAWTGLLGVVLSAATILIMAALRTDGYDHLHKAVSELGSLDAPQKWVFNTLGFLLPGLSIAYFSYGLHDHFAGQDVKKYPFYCLMASGLLMAMAGIFPADMDNRKSVLTLLHGIGSLGSGTAWLIGVFTLSPVLKKQPQWNSLHRPLYILTAITIAGIMLVPAGMPALRQRFAFAGYFLYIGLLAFRLLSLQKDKA